MTRGLSNTMGPLGKRKAIVPIVAHNPAGEPSLAVCYGPDPMILPNPISGDEGLLGAIDYPGVNPLFG